MMDPRLSFKYGAALQAAVPNPFFQVRHRRYVPWRAAVAIDRVPCGSAEAVSAVPQHVPGLDERAQGSNTTPSSSVRSARSTAGMSVLAGYAYVRGTRQEFYDNVDEYDGVWTWTDVQDPRHRLNLSVVWDVPVGRDKRWGSQHESGAQRGRSAIGKSRATTATSPASTCGSTP